MSDQIAKAMKKFSEKINKLYLPSVYPIVIDNVEINKKVQLNRTNRCKSQHIIQKYNQIQTNQSQDNVNINNQVVQINQSKDNQSISVQSQINKTSDQSELNALEIININQLINQKKKEIARQNKYYLKQISKIRQNYEMKAKLRDQSSKDRKSTDKSEELYEKCWDETIKEINKEIEENQLIVYDTIHQGRQKKIKRPKPLKSQIFTKIREHENQYFRQRSESILRKMKQKSIHLVGEVTEQIEQAQRIQKEQQYQRSKEREDGKQEIIKSLRFKEQEKLVKLLQSRPTNRHVQLTYKKNNEELDDQLSSLKKNKKKRSLSLNNCLPSIDKHQEIEINSVKQQEKVQILKKIQESSNLLNRNLLKKSRNFQQQSYQDLSAIIKGQ
ncbi:unnamed protein product [Paramecium pentaurelia]|uniref:Uncharacterized protein n=1 Tax=Paramecium pentaurelia TaxID=43138 RepID=A0A8S1T581_9CILI|nr:unnamed protein product [Paramecium pentaurelia]